MKNKILIIIIIIILPFAVISFLKKETNFNLPQKPNVKEQEKEYKIKLQKNENVEELDLEEYVIGVVAGEMPASFELEALKAQAIASRTYALYKKELNNEYDVTATTSDQVYLDQEQMQQKWQESYDKYYSKVKQAVDETKNLVIKYNNEIIKSYYFAMSNGYTEDAINVFNESQNYLQSVESKDEEEVTDNITKVIAIDKNTFCELLEINCASIEINNIEKSPTGRVNSIIINNKEFTGTEIRKILDLRSTDFIISILDKKIKITTKGYGHGVGMSQYGANAMAKKGYNYTDILQHYYKDVTIDAI